MLIAGPNLTTDRVVTIDDLRPGEVLRGADAHVAPGGKGVNVARAARSLGIGAHLVGLVPGRTGRAVADLLGDEGMSFSGVAVTGEVRAAVIIVEATGRVTVVNEPGPALASGEWDAYEKAVTARLSSGVLVCTGSLPPGAPPDAYARLVAGARSASVPVVVDAAGGVLGEALVAGPDVVCPSLSEAEGVLHGRSGQAVEDGAPDAGERAVEAARQLVGRGAGVALVTAGAAGVAAARRGTTSWWPAPSVEAVNPIGAGDAFVAGFTGALEGGSPLDEAVAAGVAAGAASVETPLPARLELGRVRELAARRRR